ncbi:MAG: dimethylargininase [Phycisphaeraceae bacterium]|nr:dimethylargininase [Phycisphaeraceae bacterium]MCB9847920.1 dimethylargininase [Phycisphaeraceae bacterium]
MLIAITRPPTPSIADCQLTHMDREPIDVARAIEQHRAYRELLAELGAEVITLDPLPEHPDAVFVEDAVIMLDEVAVLCRMGAPTRRNETGALEPVIAAYRQAHRMTAPATLEGGDVILAGRTLFVGRSTRTNDEGADQLRAFTEPLGYRVVQVGVHGCLHLSTGASSLGDGVILANPEWVDAGAFEGCRVIPVEPGDPWAANTMNVNGVIVLPDSSKPTADKLRRMGYRVRTVDISELMKAEGSLTCMRQLFQRKPLRVETRPLGLSPRTARA